MQLRKLLFGKANTRDTCTIDTEEVYDILQSTRRRRIIDYLATADGEVSLRELSTHISELEGGAGRQAIYVAIYQSHVPVLAQHDVVRYDQERGVVEATKNCELLASILDSVQERL